MHCSCAVTCSNGTAALQASKNMQPSTSLTTFDLRKALERGVRLSELETQLLRRMKLPAASRAGEGLPYLLEQTFPDLAGLVRQ